MVRVARKESPTAYYHIMARGNNREAIFAKAAEKRYFGGLLQDKIEDKKILIAAYCLMDNHVHLIVHADLLEMIETFKWVNNKFAGRYNYKYNRVGHVFQGRYKSEIIDTDQYLMRAVRYIHNNPVSAKMVTSPSLYKWSSYNGYLGVPEPLLDANERQKILGLFGGSMDEFEATHFKEETYEFLEIKEDLEREREETARRIIKKHQRKNVLTGNEEPFGGKAELEKLIIELVKRSHLPHRRIAELLGLNRGIVHGVVKRMQD